MLCLLVLQLPSFNGSLPAANKWKLSIKSTNMPVLGGNIPVMFRVCDISRFQVALRSHDFLELYLEELLALIKDDRLNVRGEEVVFEAAVHWVSTKLKTLSLRWPQTKKTKKTKKTARPVICRQAGTPPHCSEPG